LRELLGATLAEASQMVIVDMEASVEHMRRATVRYIETLLIVTEPYFRSLESAARLVRLGRELEIPNIVGLANKVRTEQEEGAIRSYLEKLEIPLVAVLPFDDAVTAADLDGTPLLDSAPESPLVQGLELLRSQVLT